MFGTCIILIRQGVCQSHYECISLTVNHTGFITELKKKCVKYEACWTYFKVTKSFSHGYCFIKICRAVWNVLSYMYNQMLKVTSCSTQILWNVSLAHYRGDGILLIETGFPVCHVCFTSPHYLNFKEFFPSRNRLLWLTPFSHSSVHAWTHVRHAGHTQPHL